MPKNSYKDGVQQYKNILRYIGEEGKLSDIALRAFKNLDKKYAAAVESDPTLWPKYYQEYVSLYNRMKMPPAANILKLIQEPEQPTVSDVQAKAKGRAEQYNIALNYLRRNKKISAKQFEEWKSIAASTVGSAQAYLDAISLFWIRHKFPPLKDILADIEKAKAKVVPVKGKGKNAPEEKPVPITAPGLDASQYSEKKKALIGNYIDYLQKLTGKKVSFQ